MKTRLILVLLILMSSLVYGQNSQEEEENVNVDSIINDLKMFIPGMDALFSLSGLNKAQACLVA
jgi:hypothetical protein